MVKGCIFCEIVAGIAPSYKIWEDKNYLAILDIFPNIMGQTVVMSKKHRESYAFVLEDKELAGLIVATKKVANLLEKKMRVGRVHMILEGTGVNHLHAKLYPAVGTNRGFEQAMAEQRIRFGAYPGYVTSLMGPKANDKELKELHKHITKKSKV